MNQIVLDDLYRWTLSQGVTDVRLEVYSDNNGAIRAYEKAGFVPYILQMHASIGIRRAEQSELGSPGKAVVRLLARRPRGDPA